jgi:hypothetical protein
MVGDDAGRLQVGELDEGRKRAGRTALGRPLMCGHALRRRRRYAFGRLDNRADGLGRALRERRQRSVLLLRVDDLSYRAPPLRPRRRDSRMQRSPVAAVRRASTAVSTQGPPRLPEACLGAQPAKLCSMGLRDPVARSTLDDANELRDWRVCSDLAGFLSNGRASFISSYGQNPTSAAAGLGSNA